MSLFEEIKKPYNLMSTIIALIGVILAIWFYCSSQEEREPYFLAKEPLQVFDRNVSLPSIRLIDKGGNAINENVYLMEVSFWNAGKKPIEPPDVRIPLALRLVGVTRILDYGVVGQNQPKITDFALVPITGASDQLGISFKHLDPGLGGRFRIIYTGRKDPGVSIEGAVVGAEIKRGGSPLDGLLPHSMAIGLSGGLGALVFQISKEMVTRVPKELSVRRRRWMQFLIILITALLCIFLLKFISGFKLPPV